MHPERDRENSLLRVTAIVREAGAATLRFYDGDVAVSLKADRSPVTAADHAAHDSITQALAEWTPGIPVVSEEGELPAPADQASLGRFWLVDPLDGTKEFLSRNGEFTVNVALIEDGIPAMGAVYAPALDLLYTAARGMGSWKTEGALAPGRITSRAPDPGRPLVVAESRSHPSPELEAWLAGKSVARRVQAGSSIKLCWVAEGKADVYPRFGTTMEWDVAAGDCVYRYSGVDRPRRSPLTYNKPGFRNGPFVLGLEDAGPGEDA
ncbi:MAG: 3'(2'),5'-bisphosphate nucleotidase CysQ [Gemmatimonadales bacterium]